MILLLGAIVALSYALGALTGPLIAQALWRGWRRLFGRRRDPWKRYFDE